MTGRFTGSIALATIMTLLFFLAGTRADAQVTIQPSLGLQTMTFNGDYPARQPISPGNDRNLPLGGGFSRPYSGLRLQGEIFPSSNDMIRIPVSLEYFHLVGSSTFSITSFSSSRRQRLTLTHTADVISIGTGVTVSLFDVPTLYVSGEMKGNFIPATSLNSRVFYSDSDETRFENTSSPKPATFRLGAFIKVGSQVEFFKPLLLDFNVGYGALNLIGKETDPNKSANILVVDSELAAPETTVGYFSLGLGVVWKL